MVTSTIQITDITGPMFLSLLFNFGLYGMLCLQVYTYYMAFPTDRIAFKVLVYGCFVVESIQTSLFFVDGFGVFVTYLGDFSSLDKARLYWLSVAIITAVAVSTGQILHAYRLRVIYKSYTLPMSVTLLSLCATVAQFAIGAHIYTSGRLSSVCTDSSVLVVVCFLSASLCDIEIAVFIVYYLIRQRVIPNSRLHHQIKHLIRLVIETSSFTTTAHILSFVLYTCYKNSAYFVVPYTMLNTLLLMFNNRMVIRGGRNDVDDCGDIVTQWFADAGSDISGDNPGTPSQTGGDLEFRRASDQGFSLRNLEGAYSCG